jgi:uncharacterized protein (TIGR03067 family)
MRWSCTPAEVLLSWHSAVVDQWWTAACAEALHPAPGACSLRASVGNNNRDTAMKLMRVVVLFGLMSVINPFLSAGENEVVKKDMAQLQGEWSMVSGSADGQPMPEQMLKQIKRICKADETTTTMAGQVFFKAKFSIDPSKSPKTIDYQMTEGFTKGQKQLGIYELDGDTFKACFGSPGALRPSDFTSKPRDGRTLSVWKRQKPTTETAEPNDRVEAAVSALYRRA